MKRLFYPTVIGRDYHGSPSPKALLRPTGAIRLDTSERWVDYILESKSIEGADEKVVAYVERERERVRMFIKELYDLWGME